MHRVKKFDVLSVAKISGMCYFAMGLLLVPFFLLFSMIAGIASKQSGDAANAFSAAFGVGFAIMAPFIYGVMGFIMGAIMALIYNLISKWVGGIEVELEPMPAPMGSLIPQPNS